MKRLLLLMGLIFGVFFSGLALANTEDTEKQMQTFYQKKDAILAKNIIKSLSDEQWLEQKDAPYASIFGFIVGLLIENPRYSEEFKKMNLSEKMRKTIQNAEKSVSFTRGNIDMYANPDEIWEPANLDTLWAMFFATGNEKIPESIRVFIEKEKKRSEQDHVINVTAMAAEWSLNALAKEHPIIHKSADKLNSVRRQKKKSDMATEPIFR